MPGTHCLAQATRPRRHQLANTIEEAASQLDVLEQKAALIAEDNFQARTEVLDAIESDVLERTEEIAAEDGEAAELQALRCRAHGLRSGLEEANRQLFEKLRDLIRSGNCRGAELARILRSYAGYDSDEGQAGGIGYDSLDALVSGVLLAPPAPGETRPRGPEMVYYQPTPARVVLDLVGKARLSHRDIFYDLGSGLGQVVILVHVLSGVRAVGLEYEPAYCTYAQHCADDLGLHRVAFVNSDVREADLSEGTAFYLYTPFKGEMLDFVLRRLKAIARSKPIRLFTYGTCTTDVLRQDWLRCEDSLHLDPERLAVFYSI